MLDRATLISMSDRKKAEVFDGIDSLRKAYSDHSLSSDDFGDLLEQVMGKAMLLGAVVSDLAESRF